MIAKLLPLLRRKGWERGVMHTDGRWFVVWLLATVVARSKQRKKQGTLVYRTTLRPGQRLAISLHPDGGVEEAPA